MSEDGLPQDKAQDIIASPDAEQVRALSRRASRRRILQAAVSAPVVFTIPTGAALAATSSSCDTNIEEMALTQSASMPPTVTSSPDGWLRYSVQKYSIPQQSGSVYGFYLPKGYDEYWYRVDGGTATMISLMPGSGSGNKPVEVPGQQYHLLVNYEKFQQSSDPAVFADPTETNDSPMSGSCWASISGENGDYATI